MSFNRTASQFAPLLLRNGTRSAFHRSLRVPRQLPAVAILVPRRGLSGEPSTSNSDHSNYPPPGFNADQAKKPLQDGQSKQKQSKSASASSDVAVPEKKPTDHAEEEQSLKDLAAQKARDDQADEKKVEKKKEEDKKLTLREKIMKEVHHYWDGTKLLGTEVKISTKLALKMGAGYELTRREHRQVSCSFPRPQQSVY